MHPGVCIHWKREDKDTKGSSMLSVLALLRLPNVRLPEYPALNVFIKPVQRLTYTQNHIKYSTEDTEVIEWIFFSFLVFKGAFPPGSLDIFWLKNFSQL